MPSTLRNVRGFTQLAFDACVASPAAWNGMHETIARRALSWVPTPARPGRAHGLIPSTVYGVIRGAMHACAKGVDLSLDALPEPPAATPLELRTLAALNGVFGDHLEATRNPLAIRMSPIKDGHTKITIIDKIHRREEIYQGKYFDRAPDLVIEPKHGYDLKGAFSKESLLSKGVFSGMHTYDNAFVYVDHKDITDWRHAYEAVATAL